ncbi:MAG: hypothetical protein KAI74_01970 [Kiritimatiellae bacterium]|nr:hypothetical protein [Kiritimatiellia bacterium]
MRITILTMILIAACGCGSSQQNLDSNQIVGLWEVDFDLTMEEVKKSPKYDPQDSSLPVMIKGMMATMKVQITDTDMIYSRSGRQVSFPYSVTSSDTTSIILGVQNGTNTAAITITLRDADHMNFKSSASDDMDYYVWQRSTEK